MVETLGVDLELTPAQVARCVDEVGIGFLYAPLLHTAMKHVMAARRELGVRTVFNLLGPLTNPAGANAQVIGVSAAALTEPLARVLAELGTLRAFVVHGADGLDEISNTGESRISEVREGAVRTFTVRPEDFGLPRAAIGDLRGGDREQNAADHPRDPRRRARAPPRHRADERRGRAGGRATRRGTSRTGSRWPRAPSTAAPRAAEAGPPGRPELASSPRPS